MKTIFNLSSNLLYFFIQLIAVASFLTSTHNVMAESEEVKTIAEQNFLKAKQDMIQWGSKDQVVDYEAAKIKAKDSGQTLLVLLSATWCGYCPSLISEVRTVLDTNSSLSSRYLLHPIVVQTSETIDKKLYAYDNVSGMRLAHLLFEPFAEGSNLTFNQAISGFPTLLMIDPSSDLNSRIINTTQFELPQSEWASGQYHSNESIVKFLNSFGFKNNCLSFL